MVGGLLINVVFKLDSYWLSYIDVVVNLVDEIFIFFYCILGLCVDVVLKSEMIEWV